MLVGVVDTAGRTHIDEPLMQEMADIKSYASPHEILLVADALTGQDAVNLAKNFDERVGFDTERNVHTGHSGTYASQFAVSGLSAVHGAVQMLKAEILRLAAFVLKAPQSRLEMGVGKQGPDHPLLPGFGEGAYLKTAFAVVR